MILSPEVQAQYINIIPITSTKKKKNFCVTSYLSVSSENRLSLLRSIIPLGPKNIRFLLLMMEIVIKMDSLFCNPEESIMNKFYM